MAYESSHTHSPIRASFWMKKAAIVVGTALLIPAVYAQSHTQEASPPTNTKPQVNAEARKNAKPVGAKQIRDGSTAEGEGSGVKKTSKSEMTGEGRATAREARPHRVPVQGGTPK